jgi:FixJ family two-component response regulator
MVLAPRRKLPCVTKLTRLYRPAVFGVPVLRCARFHVRPKPCQAQTVTGAKTIAVIDDDAAVRDATSRLVRSLGYVAATYASATDFLNSGRVGEVSCALTDVRMPDVDGIELQRRLIAEGHRCPVIFMTAFPEERVRQRALAAGAFGFLTKPCKTQSLIDCIDAALQA